MLEKKTWLDPIFTPIERIFYKISGIDSLIEMTWKQQMVAMLTINMIWFLLGMAVLMNQGSLTLNPDNNPSMSADLAFNTVISFVVNCNLQHYSGETGLSYLGQYWLMFLQFVSAGTGMAAAVVLFRAFRDKSTNTLGNFYVYLIKSCTRILLPLSFVMAIFLAFDGVPMTFEGKDAVVTLQGDTVEVSRGPAAAFVSIKHLGTKGGGFFGVNSAHPFENPSYLSNMVEMVAQLIVPLAMIFAFGYFIRRRKLSWMIFGVMTVGFLMLTIPNINMEMNGSPAIAAMGIDNSLGAMEGKEIRFGAASSGFWSIVTTVISTGSVNAMHDSTMPLSGMNQLLAMMINAFYGGCGVGLLNFFIFIILAVFISGLMVGRTPEFLGKKVEAREMKIAMIIALLHPFLILVGTALATAFPDHGASTLNKLYENMLEELRRLNDPMISKVIDHAGSLACTVTAMTELQSWIRSHPFEDDNAEIYFFKHVKPRFQSWHIYIVELYHMVDMIPVSTDQVIKKYYLNELKVINRFFKRHAFYYQYYQSAEHTRDADFFLSRNLKHLPNQLRLVERPTGFYTSLDFLFAKFKAFEMLRDCIIRRTKELEKKHELAFLENELTEKRRWWSGNKIELVELAYDLYHSKRINDGKAELGEIISWLETSLNVDLAQSYRMFTDISRRKLVSHTKFLDEMQVNLLNYIQNSFGSKFK